MDELIRKQDVLNEIGEWIDASKYNRHEQSASDLRLVRNSIKKMPPANNRLIQIIEKGIKATGTADEYSVGMCNGMKWCKSLLDGKEPEYDTVQPNHNAEVSKMEIVCCENCEHWDTSWETVCGSHYCPVIDMGTEKNFFCKYGAEKKGGTDEAD